MTELSPAVAAEIESVRTHFAGLLVVVDPDGSGGAFVIVEGVDVGPLYTPRLTWFGFHISNSYPDADVYPHNVGVVARVDGSGHGEAISAVTWHDRAGLQLSRRSNRWDPAHDTATNKAERVLRWFAGR